MKNKYSALILEILATAATLVSFYTYNVFVGIAATPVAIVCLIYKYTDEDKNKYKDEKEEE